MNSLLWQIRPVLVLLAVSVGLLAEIRAQEPQKDARTMAMEALRAIGASVQPLAQDAPELVVNFTIHAQQAGDGDLAPLAELGNVVELLLGRTKVSDAGLVHVAKLTTLTRLNLHKTAVSDAGLEQLKHLHELSYLNLYDTQISDAGLVHLAELKKLSRLYVWGSKVTPEAAKKLEAAIPGLIVDGGWDKPIIEEKKVLTCCEQAQEAKRACEHPCCVAATAKGRTCFACNPSKAVTCCEKAEAAGKACEHPCCIEATKNGKLCEVCNPPAPPKPAFKPGSCCDKAEKAGKACEHPCCVEATKAGKVCETCNS